MIIKINGNISSYYVQTLCLIFFPGAKFSQSEVETEYTPSVKVDLEKTENGYKSLVVLQYGANIYRGCCALEHIEKLSRPEMAAKICVGRAFLEAGEKLCSSSVPWGILTGVRPSKFPLARLKDGVGFDECIDELVREYSVTPDKARLAVTVAAAENRIITPELYKKCSVYIAIPFCPTRCSYCSFVSFTSERLLGLIPEYIEVLKKEIKRVFALIKELKLTVSTIYIGGGTPTVLNEAQLYDLLKTVKDCTDVSVLEEYTLEAGRPDTITRKKLEIAKQMGVTRISVNPQTLNDDILVAIGRDHSVADFYRAYQTAREVGIDCINIDLIAGLPGDTYESFTDSLDGVLKLDAENVTVHTFSVKKAARVRREEAHVYNSRHDTAAASVDYAFKTLSGGSYVPYYMYRQKNTMGNLENTGYSKQGHEGLYNIIMMEELHSVFAVGASSISKLVYRDADGHVRIERCPENKYPFEYLDEKRELSDDSPWSFEERAKEFYSKYF